MKNLKMNKDYELEFFGFPFDSNANFFGNSSNCFLPENLEQAKSIIKMLLLNSVKFRMDFEKNNSITHSYMSDSVNYNWEDYVNFLSAYFEEKNENSLYIEPQISIENEKLTWERWEDITIKHGSPKEKTPARRKI